MRCAIYAQFSSDLQRPTSIEDQLRRCKEFAAKQGWTILEEYVRADEAKTAATLAGRDALKSLMTAAKTKPKPFDCLLVDDTSRLARYLPDVLDVTDILCQSDSEYTPAHGASGNGPCLVTLRLHLRIFRPARTQSRPSGASSS